MVAAVVTPAPEAQAADHQPNIILLSTDDQTVSDLAVMANVNRLLTEQGTTFSNSFAPFPLCCPALATILTGQYAHNHGVLGNGGGLWPVGGYDLLDGSNTLPLWLQDAGYQTAFIGKFMVGYNQVVPREVPPGWTEWHAVVGGDYFVSRMFEKSPQFPTGVVNEYKDIYSTDLWSGMAQQIITDRLQDDAPLFLWTSFKGPHNAGPVESDDPPFGTTPARAARHVGLFADEPLPMDPSFNEADVSDKPQEMREKPSLTQADIDYITVLNQQRLEAVLALDEAVRDIVAAIEATGETDNTLIVFTSDNGFLLGQHRVPAGKGLPYEESIRVPLIMRGPGIPQGVVRPEMVATIDLAATFVDAAQADAGLVLDGVSLLPQAGVTAVRTSRLIVIEAGPRTVDGPMYWRGVRHDRIKYVEWGTGEIELYDLRTDPYEIRSQHANPKYLKVLNYFAAELARLKDCAGEVCRS